MLIHHCTMEELLAIRDGRGTAAARGHLDGCEECMMELERLHQRIAQLKALPSIQPSRDRWPVVRRRMLAEQRREKFWKMSWVGLAAAAAAVLALGVQNYAAMSAESPVAEMGPYIVAPVAPGTARAGGVQVIYSNPRLNNLARQARELEVTLRQIQPESRVMNGRLAVTVLQLEDGLQVVDQRLSDINRQRQVSVGAVEELLQARVQLMDQLVKAHTVRTAAYVGF